MQERNRDGSSTAVWRESHWQLERRTFFINTIDTSPQGPDIRISAPWKKREREITQIQEIRLICGGKGTQIPSLLRGKD